MQNDFINAFCETSSAVPLSSEKAQIRQARPHPGLVLSNFQLLSLYQSRGTLVTLVPDIIPQKVFIKAFRKSQLPHRSVNLSFTITNIKDKLTDLWGS